MSTSAKEIAEEAAALVGVTLDRCDFSHRRLTEILLPFIERGASCASGEAAERAMIEAKRGGFESGVHWFYGRKEVVANLGYIVDEAPLAAARLYPMPHVSRPRVVTDASKREWRVVDGKLEYRGEDHRPWSNAEGCSFFITSERVRILADLLANPTELVDADAGVSL